MTILKACVVCSRLSPESRCPKHRRKAWEDRPAAADRSQLSGSRQQKRARYILAKYELTCHVCKQFGADQVDHVIPLAEGGADDESNLRPIHSEPCHREKTAREAQRGRGRLQTDCKRMPPNWPDSAGQRNTADRQNRP